MRQEIYKYYHKSKVPLSTDTDSVKLCKKVLHGHTPYSRETTDLLLWLSRQKLNTTTKAKSGETSHIRDWFFRKQKTKHWRYEGVNNQIGGSSPRVEWYYLKSSCVDWISLCVNYLLHLVSLKYSKFWPKLALNQ